MLSVQQLNFNWRKLVILNDTVWSSYSHTYVRRVYFPNVTLIWLSNRQNAKLTLHQRRINQKKLSMSLTKRVIKRVHFSFEWQAIKPLVTFYQSLQSHVHKMMLPKSNISKSSAKPKRINPVHSRKYISTSLTAPPKGIL